MDDDQGVSEYQTALKLDPRNAGTYVLLGTAQKKGGHAELGEKAYRQALEIEPNNIVALNNLAWIAMMTPERAGEAVGYAKGCRSGTQDGTSAGYPGWAHVNGENELASQTCSEEPRLLQRIRGSCITLQWCMERKGINKRNRRR
jgi:tetratricopeptide (TPR) repeat protein